MNINKLVKPKVAWMTINRGCNNKCCWCYAQNAVNDLMSFGDMRKCVNNLIDLGIRNIILIGGEPTIYPHIIETIKYIHDFGIKVMIVSNGRRFSDYSFAQKCVESGISGIDISIKGFSKVEYINNTGVDGFEEVIVGYRNLMKLNFKPTLSYVVCDNRESKIIEMYNFLETYNLEDITIQFVKPVVSENSNAIMPLDEMGSLVGKIYEIMEKSNKHYRIEVSFPLCLIKESILVNLIKNKKIVTCCHLQKGTGLVLDTNFRALPCNHFVDMPYSETQIGLYSANQIIDYWNSLEVGVIREKTLFYPSNKCIKCNLWDLCGGGCYTRWLFENPNDYI